MWTDLRNGSGGLFDGEDIEKCRDVDAWGQPYVVVIDANNDNQFANPDVINASARVRAGAPVVIKGGALVYSRGPDGIEGTEDDIVFWRPPVPPVDVWHYAEPVMWAVVVIGLVQGILATRDGWRAIQAYRKRRDSRPQPSP